MRSLTLRACALGLALGLLAPAAPADEKKVELKVGDAGPKFDLRDEANKTWSSSDFYGKKWVVIYFYPGDFTPGCTAQAKAFRDAMEKLREQGVEVIGISGDSVTTHDLFKKAQKLNFTLLSDEDGEVAKRFGVPVTAGATVKARDADNKPIEFKRNVTLARWTFVIDKDGNIAYVNTKVTPADDAKKITDFITNAEKK